MKKRSMQTFSITTSSVLGESLPEIQHYLSDTSLTHCCIKQNKNVENSLKGSQKYIYIYSCLKYRESIRTDEICSSII